LTASDLGSYPKLDIDFTSLSLTSVTGDNGSGKSTIFDAVRIALYGAAVGDLAGFVRQGADRMTLTLDFTARGKQYRVQREYGKQGQKATLHLGDTPVCEAKVRDVDAAIISIVGADHATFVLTHMLPQGSLTRFVTLSAADRKAWLASQLPLGPYAALEDAAKAVVRECEQAVSKAGVLLESAESRLSALGTDEPDAEAAQKTLESATLVAAAARSELAATQARYNDYEAAARLHSKWDADKAGIEANLTSVRQRISQLTERANSTVEFPQIDVEAAEQRIRELRQSIAEVETAYAAHEQRVTDARREVNRAVDLASRAKVNKDAAYSRFELAEAQESKARTQRDETLATAKNCPACGATPEHQDREQVARTLEKVVYDAEQSTGEARKAEATTRQEWVDAEKAVEEARKVLAAAEASDVPSAGQDKMELADLEKQLADYHSKQAAIGAVEEANRQLADEKKREAELQGELRECVDNEPTELQPVDLSAAQQAVTSAESQEREAQASLDTITRTIEERTKLTEETAKMQSEQDVALHEQTVAAMLVKAYGKNGIQARILDSAVDEIAGHANDFLARFTDGLSVELRTQRDNKSSDGIRETLDVLVTDSSGTRPIERFSGGETTRVCFALAAGLSAFVQSRTDASAECFAADEPEFLDQQGLEEMLNCLHIIAENVPLVMLVSHYEGVSDSLPQRIRVSKTGAGSKAVVE